jgi:hypothetical protein
MVWLLLIILTIILAVFMHSLGNWNTPLGKNFAVAQSISLTAFLIAGVITCGFFMVFVANPLFRWLCWRHWRRTLFALACFITLIALFYAEEGWRGKGAWEKFKREWEAKGEKFDRASLVPPAVPEDQNFALTPIVASSYETFLDQNGQALQPRNTNVVNRLQMNIYGDRAPSEAPTNGDWRLARACDLSAWQQYYCTLAAKTNSFPIAREPQSPAADVLLALSRYASTIEELRQASRLPYSRFPLEYDKDNPAAMLLPHLAALKNCAQILQLRAVAELQNDQSDRALADVKLILRLTDSIRNEPILISHLVRIAMLNITLQPVWEGLAGHRWSDAQLVELDSELARLDFLSDYQLAMRGEMVLFQGGIFDYLRRHPEQLANLSDSNQSDNPPFPGRAAVRMIPRGWLYQNQLHCARPMVEWYLPLADTQRRVFSPSAARQADAAVTADTQHLTPYNLIERLLLPALGAAARKFASGQATVDLARVAIALERYRLARGEYPEKLDVLAPQFIAEMPHDVVNGQPLNYRRTANGQFVLYSVGWNEKDDDGEVGLNSNGSVDIRNGDWVWRYPPKAE